MKRETRAKEGKRKRNRTVQRILHPPHNYDPMTPAACALALLSLVSAPVVLLALVPPAAMVRLDDVLLLPGALLEPIVPALALLTIPLAELDFALFAAATALSIFPALGLFLGAAPVALTLETAEEAEEAAEEDTAEEAEDEAEEGVGANFSRSIFFRNGEGKFSSSLRSYFGGEAGVEAERAACGRPLAFTLGNVCVCEPEDEDAVDDDEAA